MSAARPATSIDRIAEAWVDTLVAHEPTIGTMIGRNAANGRLPDFSPAGADAFAEGSRAALAALTAAAPVDAVDAVTQADLGAELRLSLAEHEAGEHLRDLNVIESPSQGIREAFDLMPADTADDWAVVAERLRAVPQALAGYRESLALGASRGMVPAIRQVREVAEQALRGAGTPGRPGFFTSFVAAAGASRDAGGRPSAVPPPAAVPASLRAELASAAASASAAYGEFSEYLTREIAPHAPAADAFGRERYALASEGFLGLKVDLDETYEWGLDELARMTAEQERVAHEILPGASVAEAIAFLDQDAARKLVGTDALQRWMQETSDRAVAELGETHFDIPAEIRTLQCMIAPTQEGGIYYTGPTDDFSRPGRMWWSVPEGDTEFDTWRELTTVYHEGVPGHHLQIGQAVVNRDSLNEWRRQLAGTSGHAEGWALYAERLMEQLGYLDDPADRLGMLDGQRLRAARVVLDIGVHLGKQRPGGGVWDGEYAFEFLRDNVSMSDSSVRFEVLRYLGWAGQAPAYKVGQRVWEDLRDESAARAASAGAEFNLRAFHSQALGVGGVRLDTLQRVLRGELGA